MDDAPLLGYVLDDKYALVDLLGGGGYGSVYLGLQQPLGREVAVKLLRGLALNNRTVRELFEREAVALAKLSSPHTVRLIDYGVTREGPVGLRNLPYMVMERLSGEDLERRLMRDGALSPSEVSRLLEGVTDSLAEAHAHGVIHRDLKPSNVLMVPTRQGALQPKVIDFGIARIESPNRSPTGMIMGTPEYMAPEQVRGGAAMDHRVDQYALGVMVFELLTNRTPFAGQDAVAVLTKHATEPPPPLTYMDDDPVMTRLSPVVQRAMAKNPDDRYPDVDAFRMAYDEALHGGAPPVVSRPRSAASRTAMMFSRPVASAPPVSAPPVSAPPVSAPPAEIAPATPTPMQVPLPAPRLASTQPPAPLPTNALVRVDTAELARAVPAIVPEIVAELEPAPPPPRVNRGRSVLIVGLVVAGGLAGAAAYTVQTRETPATPSPPDAASPGPIAVVEPATSAPTLPPTAAPSSAPPTLPPTAAPPTAAPSSAPPTVPPTATPSFAPRPAAPVGPDPQVNATAAAAEAELRACRCSGAQRLVETLAGLRGGAGRADALRPALKACKPIDVDHKCVDGKLVFSGE